MAQLYHDIKYAYMYAYMYTIIYMLEVGYTYVVLHNYVLGMDILTCFSFYLFKRYTL